MKTKYNACHFTLSSLTDLPTIMPANFFIGLKTQYICEALLKKVSSCFLVLLLGILIHTNKTVAQSSPETNADKYKKNETSLLSVKEVCSKYPERVQILFNALNLDYPGLNSVKKAAAEKNWAGACNELVNYYRNSKSASWLRLNKIPLTAKRESQGDSVISDIFTFQSVSGKHPRLANGQLDWQNKGPNNDIEWTYFLNRHFFYSQLLRAYKTTGNEVYPQSFSNLVSDWVISNPFPKEGKKTTNPAWRLLEAGLRMGEVWPGAFYNLQSSEGFSTAARILMLSSLPDHADYLLKNHGRQHNHAAMELNGLNQIALCWPEFKDADTWHNHAIAKMMEELELEVYADGVQKELTNHYHNVALANFESFKDNTEAAKKPLPEKFIKTIEAMYNYSAYALRPDGKGLLNNDSDLNDERNLITRESEEMNRSDWKYIASNGKEGKKPAGTPSVFFPWAGHMFMRNGWDANSQWSFFDVGPWGLAHQQNDKLHFSLFANGQDLLVDAGRLYYKPDDWRLYFNLSKSHNVILVDGKGQNQIPPGTVEKPLPVVQTIQPEFDFCMATFDGGFGDRWDYSRPFQYHNATDTIPAKHTRAVIYLKDEFWVVVDKIDIDKARKITPLWHFNPTCEVKIENNNIVTTNAGRGNLRIIPVSDFNWNIKLIKGQEKPEIQGWYSEHYNKKEANFCAQYNANLQKSSVFAWVMLPAVGEVPHVKTELLASSEEVTRMKITVPDKAPVEIAVRINSKGSVNLSNGLTLDGACAILREGKAPLVAEGKIKDKTGRTVKESFMKVLSK